MMRKSMFIILLLDSMLLEIADCPNIEDIILNNMHLFDTSNLNPSSKIYSTENQMKLGEKKWLLKLKLDIILIFLSSLSFFLLLSPKGLWKFEKGLEACPAGAGITEEAIILKPKGRKK